MIDVFDFAAQAVVVDAGEMPVNPLALGWVDKGLPVVCCDGAADRFLASGRIPWRIVGDCDSMSEDVKTRYSDIIRYFPDQETNDQTKAVTYLSKRGIKEIVILGATGMREDHTIGNISLLIEYLKHGIEARIYTDYGVFIPVNGTKSFKTEKHCQVSIFNFGARDLKAEGLRYPLRDFDYWWQGTLNEATDGEFTIFAEGFLIVFITFHPKRVS